MKSKTVKIIGSLIVAAVIVVGARSLLLERKEQIANTPLPQVSYTNVIVTTPQEGSLEQKEHFLAQLDADKSIQLSTKIPGYIERVYVQESQEVKKGALLVKIDESEILASIASLRSTLSMQIADAKVAKSIYERNKKLYDAGGLPLEKLELSKVALEAKEAQVEATKQKIAQLNNQREYLTIKAPFDGVVDKILLHKGDLAVTGKPILTMNNQKQKLLFSYAKEKIKVGDSVLYQSQKIGEVRSIYPTSTNGLTTADVVLNTQLSQPIGAQIDIDVVVDAKEGCIVPSNSIVHKKDGAYVMVHKQDRFYPQKVKVVLTKEDKVVLEECPAGKIAQGSETKLSQLPAYTNITIVGN